MLDSSEPEFTDAEEILARLERYVAAHRPPTPIEETYPATTLDVLPAKARRRRFDPATVDLFPYDLIATIVGCALTIISYAWFGRPVALAITAALAVGGIEARRRHWFPALAVNLVIGLVAGLIFVFTA